MTNGDPQTQPAPPPALPAGVHACVNCVHMNRRPELQLFSGEELQTAGGIKAATEWESQEKQFAQREESKAAVGEPFPWEPHHYAWCDAYTQIGLVTAANTGDAQAQAQLMREGGAELNPVTGEFVPLYFLCIHLNHDGRCERYEPAEP